MFSQFTVSSLAEGGVVQGYSPSQNIVDMFETKNGLAIQDDPEYDAQNPYIDRDPRFYHSILFNRERWTSGTDLYLELYNGGRDRASGDLKQLSYTGYLARKFWEGTLIYGPGFSTVYALPFTSDMLTFS